MNIPNEFEYFSVSLTLRCNFGCSYCINERPILDRPETSIVRNRNELCGKEWVETLNRIDLPAGLPITIEGGEPSLHPDFYYIITQLKKPINILTNLSFDVDEFIGVVDPAGCFKTDNPAYKSIRISYHHAKSAQDELIKKTVELQDAGFRVGIFAISHPDAINKNIEMAEKCREERIYFFVKDFLGYYLKDNPPFKPDEDELAAIGLPRDFGPKHPEWNIPSKQNRYHTALITTLQKLQILMGIYRYPAAINGIKKSCLCRTNEVLVGPGGRVFKCHRDLYKNELPIGTIIDPEFEITHEFRPCTNYGLCNFCDVKLKTNRWLREKYSSVEIKPI